MKKWIAFLIPIIGHASSVTLLNDSPFKLKAQILSADGRDLGTIEILPQHQFKWQDSNQNIQSFTATPFTVIWYCGDGQEYGVSSRIATGALTAAQASSGRRYCRPKKKEAEAAPTSP